MNVVTGADCVFVDDGCMFSLVCTQITVSDDGLQQGLPRIMCLLSTSGAWGADKKSTFIFQKLLKLSIKGGWVGTLNGNFPLCFFLQRSFNFINHIN